MKGDNAEWRRLLADALYSLTNDAGASPDYCRGLVTGLITGLMAGGDSYGVAVSRVRQSLPDGWRRYCIPSAFEKSFFPPL